MKNEIITSRQNPLVKQVAALSERKYREATGLFRFDGLKLFFEALNRKIEVDRVIVSDEISDSAKRKIDELCLADNMLENLITYVSHPVFTKMSDESSPDGIITIAKYIDKLHKNVKIDKDGEFALPHRSEKILALESVRDPGNLGTIIRTCAALGMDRLVISSDCADIYNPKTLRAAMGALFSFPADIVSPEDFAEYITLLRGTGRRAFAATLSGQASDISELKFSDGDFFVIGNEGRGLSPSVISACGGEVYIPMKNDCESLNAAVAAAVFIWETVKYFR